MVRHGVIVHCFACGREYPPALSLVACPDCGAKDLVVGVQTPKGTRVMGAAADLAPVEHKVINLVGRDPDTGRESPFLKHYVKTEYSGRREQWEYVERIFNRLDHSYVEACYHPLSGDVTFRKAVRRDDQSAHGERGKRPR